LLPGLVATRSPSVRSAPEGDCTPVADLISEIENASGWSGIDRREPNALCASQDILRDWYMKELFSLARSQLGPLRPGFKYCLKTPGVLGGEYGGANRATMPLVSLIASSGHLARVIDGLPDGARVKLVTD
jgi:hypothetical protein